MTKKQTKSDKAVSLQSTNYIAPNIEVVEIKIEQNILTSGSGDGSLPGMPGSNW